MTGPLERPSQGDPENRKATDRSFVRNPSNPRKALRSVHGAERQLLDAAHRTVVASRLGAINGYFASLLAAVEARIVTHVQGRIAGIDPALPLAERLAAIERLQAEQAAALAR